MTLALTTNRPPARPFVSSSLTTRPGLVKPIVNVELSTAPFDDDESITSGTNQTIALLEQAAAKMADALEKLKCNEETISTLKKKLEELEQERDAAAEVKRQHAARADNLERIAAELRVAGSHQAREYARLKANADRLLAIFATDAAAI